MTDDVAAAPLRVAILGCGPRGIATAQFLVATGIGAPVGFWDRNPARAAAACAEFGGATATSVAGLVELTTPDLTAVLTHPAMRSELVASAVSGGTRAILIEKPVALDEYELARVEAAASDAFVVVSTQYQWMPHWRRYLARIRDGELGDILAISGSTVVNVLEQGSHVLSLVLAVAEAGRLGSPEWVLAGSSGSADVGGVGVPESLVATMGIGPVRLNLTAGPASRPVPGETVSVYQQQLEVVGSRGRLWVSLNQGATLWTASGGLVETERTAWPRDDIAALSAFYGDIAASLRDSDLRASFATRLERAARQSRILFAAIESARQGEIITLTG
jgi:predicted dehydrogenase